MANVTPQTTASAVRKKLEAVANSENQLPSNFLQAVQALMAAVDYQDSVLVQSSVNAIFEACRGVFNDVVQKQIGSSQRVEQAWREINDMLASRPRENYEEVRKELERSFDETLKSIADLLDGPVRKLRNLGYEVEGLPQLAREAEGLESLKKKILDNWPRANQHLPPVDRDMVTASRAAIARGDTGASIEELIRRMGGSPDGTQAERS